MLIGSTKIKRNCTYFRINFYDRKDIKMPDIFPHDISFLYAWSRRGYASPAWRLYENRQTIEEFAWESLSRLKGMGSPSVGIIEIMYLCRQEFGNDKNPWT